MPIICPTVLAKDNEEFDAQIGKIAGFAKRIQIDLTDGDFAPSKTLAPGDIWWPAGVLADIHLMYKEPVAAAKTLAKHQPNMIIVQAESQGNFDDIYKICRDAGVALGVALLAATPPEKILPQLNKIDHCLIFSGDLGSFGGRADLDLLEKVELLKKNKPTLEIGWDGGVNDSNVSQLVFGGVDVLNVGGFIQKAENPEKAYNTLFRIAEETGTT